MLKKEHSNKELVLGEIQQLLDLSDALAVEESSIHSQAEKLLDNIVKSVRSEADPAEELVDWRALTTRLAMVSEDLTSILRMLMGYYMALRSLGWEDSLQDRDKERLDYLMENNPTIFRQGEEGLEPRDQSLYDVAIENVKKRADFDEGFISKLKESELFNSEEGNVESRSEESTEEETD